MFLGYSLIFRYNQNLKTMGNSITLIEALAISLATTLGWALIKTILEEIENMKK